MQIREILKQLDIPFCLPGQHHHVRDGWVGIDCAWCPKPIGDKGRWRLGIEESTGRCNCWTCGGHSLHKSLVVSSNASWEVVNDLLRGLTTRHVHKVKPKGRLRTPIGVGLLSTPHKKYLESRGLDAESIERLWKVQGIGIDSKFSWRLFIPVYVNGEMVSWTTRSIGNNGGYISAKPEEETVRLKDTLYGIDLVRTTIIICEGPGDVWNVGPGAVATFGVMLSPAQIKTITRFPKRIVCFDQDEAGGVRGEALTNLLSVFPGETVNVQLDAEDPGSAKKHEIKLLRKMAFGE